METIGYIIIENELIGRMNDKPIYLSKNMYKNFIKNDWEYKARKGNRTYFYKNNTRYIYTSLNKKPEELGIV